MIKIIHQIWLKFKPGAPDEMPAEYQRYAQGWRDLHPDWTYILWTDAKAECFILEHCPGYLDVYYRLGREHPVMKVDLFRYILLYYVGGLYVDADAEALREMGSYLEKMREHNAVPRWQYNLPFTNFTNNCLLYARKRLHPFWKELIDRCVARFAWLPRMHASLYVSLVTGPLMMSQHRFECPDDVHLLPVELFDPCGKCGECKIDPGQIQKPYVLHRMGRSWLDNNSTSEIYCKYGWWPFVVIFVVVIYAIWKIAGSL